ncbi:hypothetical protein GYB62_02480 [bacterium]|nr:hypothetical protein [bacterium]
MHKLRQTQDGFAIAEQDLALRGGGEILGKRQSGLDVFRIADLERDHHWVPTAQRLANQMIERAPELVKPLILRWRPSAHEYLKV